MALFRIEIRGNTTPPTSDVWTVSLPPYTKVLMIPSCIAGGPVLWPDLARDFSISVQYRHPLLASNPDN